VDIVVGNIGFEFENIWIPPFKLQKGKLIKIYVPDFRISGESLGYVFVSKLLKLFSQEVLIPELKMTDPLFYAKPFLLNRFLDFFSPKDLENFLIKKSNISQIQIQDILVKLGLEKTQKIRDLCEAIIKIITIFIKFKKHDVVLFDYYGVGLHDYQKMKGIINEEILKGKCAIGFDRLEYIEEFEPYDNIERIIVKEKVNN
jgi:hypothetical protein